MRTRELLLALAAGSGAIFALLHILGADRPAAAPLAATTADREPLPAPAADAAPDPDVGEGERTDRGPTAVVSSFAYTGHGDRMLGDFRPAVPPAGFDGQAGNAPLAVPEPGSVTFVTAIAGKRNYREFVRTLGRYYEDLPRPPLPPLPEGTRRIWQRPESDQLARMLFEALDRVTDPIVRQNLIFHIAMALPAETAFPRLRALNPGGGGGDAEDALCALAFRGDPAAVRDFQTLAVRPAPVDVHRLVESEEHDRLAETGERELLRAWRCVEAIQGRPYFAIHYRVFDDSWIETPAPGGDALAIEILPSWLSRYEGHPGSDDMALRIAGAEWKAGDAASAIRWASCAATLPDSDVKYSSLALLAAAAELAPLEEALTVLPDPADPERNRSLLLYIRLRRLAAERGFGTAMEEASLLAVRDPRSPLAEAFRLRWSESPPRGLLSGQRPLAGDDPLFDLEGGAPGPREDPGAPADPEGTPLTAGNSRDPRLFPSMDPNLLRPRDLAFQFRCWETLAELEHRADSAKSAEARADLLYKEGAVLFHERDSLYPLHSVWAIDGTGRPRPVAAVPEPGGGIPPSNLEWCRRNLPRLRAAEIFERILAEAPSSPVADRSAYSLGLAFLMAAREPPLLDGHHLAVGLPESRRLLERAVDALVRCARDYPASPLARDAEGLAGRWRERLAPADE